MFYLTQDYQTASTTTKKNCGKIQPFWLPRLFYGKCIFSFSIVMNKIENQKVIEELLSDFRKCINTNVHKLMSYIEKCDNGQFLLPDETVSMFSYYLLYLEQAKLYAAGLKYWYENYQNTLNLTKLFDDDVQLDECIRFIVEEANFSSIGKESRHYFISRFVFKRAD